MLKIYGSMMCPDCVEIKKDLDKAGVSYEYKDFADSLLHLKEFLILRDSEPAFAEVKAGGKIGIPCIVREDGSVTLSWEEYM
jgi:glutaredoxin-related protein